MSVVLTSSGRVTRGLAIAMAIVGLGAPFGSGTVAQVAAPAGAAERFGDWEFVCVAGQPAAQSCRLVQNHASPDGRSALLVTLLTSAQANSPVAVVSVPKSVYLAPGIELRVDGGPVFKLLYETCNDSGCHAGFKVAGDIGAALRKGKIATHRVFDAKQQPVSVDVSLNGLAKGLDRLVLASKAEAAR